MALRIAVVHSFYASGQPSGENTQVETEVRALREAGLSVGLVAARTDDREGDPLYRVRSAARVATGRGASPLRQIEAFRPDLVHVHNLFPNYGRAWARAVDVPIVATLHNFRFTCAAGSLFRDGRLCLDCPDGDRLSAVRHRCYRGSLAATLPLAAALRNGPAADPLVARADRVLCLSDRQYGLLTAAGVDAARLLRVDNFLPDHLVPRASGGTNDGTCLYVGRFTEEKGVVGLVAHWSGDLPLVVVGDGPLRDDVRRAAVGRRVTVVGPRPRQDVLDLMSTSVALALPSVWPEVAAPLVAIEALAHGLPVLVRAESDLAGQFVPAGVGIPVESPSGFAPAAAAAAEAVGTGQRCRDLFEGRFTQSTWARRRVRLYEDLVGERVGTAAPSTARSST